MYPNPKQTWICARTYKFKDGYLPTLVINGGTLTSKWFDNDLDMQVVELVIANTHMTNYLTLADTLTFSIESTNVELVYWDTVHRIELSQEETLSSN